MKFYINEMRNLKITSSTISLTRARDKLVEAEEPSSERC